MIMTVYCGLDYVTDVECDVRVVAPGIGEIACLECEGTGWWAYMEPDVPGDKCMACKGTGKQLIMI